MGRLQTLSALLWGVCGCGAVAFAQDKLSITITNDDTDEVIVTVRDLNTSPPSTLLSRSRIGGFASMPIFVVADASGHGHVAWTAVTTDPARRRCGRKERRRLANFAAVHVYARSDCPAPRT